MKKLTPILLDLQGLVYNAYHTAMSPEPLIGDKKEKVNTAEYGFELFLSKFFDPMLDVFGSPVHMIAVLDDGNTYRKALSPTYKSDREAKKGEQDTVEKDQMAKAMAYAKQFLASMGVPLVKLKGQEADDVIAYLRYKLHGNKIIATIDKDLVALAGADCSVFRNGQLTQEFNDKGVIVPADLVSLYLSIVGDSSDSFPGLYKEGPKAWEKMVEQFGVDGMQQLRALADNDERLKIKGIAAVAGNKTLTKLAEEYNDWKIQYQLAKLHPEICESARAKLEWYHRVPQIERLTKVLTETGMLDILNRYEKFTYKQTLVTQDNLGQCLQEIDALTKDSIAVAWDYETYDPVKNPKYLEAAKGKNYVDVLNSKITGCSFALGPNLNHVYYFSVFHKDTANVPKQWVLNLIRHFEEEKVEMYAQNISFEAAITKLEFGHTIKDWNDTKALAHHVDENNRNGLKDLSFRYLNYKQVDYATTLASAGAADMSEITGEQVLSYGCDDSLVTAHLAKFLSWQTQLEGTYDFVMEYECPSVAPLMNAYLDGVMMDPEEMARQTAADETTVIQKMSLLRTLLQEHCTQPNFDAVEMLCEDQEAYVRASALAKFEDKKVDQAETDAAVKAAITNYRQKLKDGCRYIEPYEVRNPEEFIPTPAKLTKVATHLGLPPVEKVTKTFLSDYISDVLCETKPQAEFVGLLGPAVAEFKAREGEKYQALADFCNAIFYELAPVHMEGTLLNLGSNPQKQQLFYVLLGLPIRIRTKVQKKSIRHKNGLVGAPSTDASAIDFALANDCFGDNAWKAEVLKALKAYAAAATRLSIYWHSYPLWMGEDNIMHPNFISPGTVTRRPTGTSPNLLQVSKGPVRKNFVPRKPGNVIVSVDFASQELRVMAAITGDANFLSAYTGEKDKDLHAMTACGIVPSVVGKYEGVSPAEIQMNGILVDYEFFKAHQDDQTPLGKMLKDVRGISKTVNFGVGYGAVGITVSQQAMIPLDIAEKAVEGFHVSYPGVNQWKAKVYAFAKANGYVATTYGSRRHCGNNLTTGNRAEVGRWERQLSNFLIQGQCADLLKVVLAGAHRSQLFERHEAYLIAPIYDELLSEVPIVNLHRYLHELADLMEVNMPGICVKMVADCSFGPNWYEQYEVGARPTQETIDAALAEMAKKAALVADAAEAELYDNDVLALVDESDLGLDDEV